MRIHTNKPLFAWDCLEDSPSLKTIREAKWLCVILGGKRGRGSFVRSTLRAFQANEPRPLFPVSRIVI